MENGIWQDIQIRFDASKQNLQLRKGEVLVDRISNVEDTKGNPNESGTLQVTNLRAVWYQDNSPGINLSIGYNTLIQTEVKVHYSRNTGNGQQFIFKCKAENSRYEFIFTAVGNENPKAYNILQQVIQSYEGSKLYRELRLRGAIVKDKNLIILPDEKVINRYTGVYNLSSDQGNIGTFFVTNVRIVWFANSAESFNVSVPYIQIKLIKKKDSKFGVALVIESIKSSGSYILGFKVENIEVILIELQKLHQVYLEKPIFGVSTHFEDQTALPQQSLIPTINEDVTIVSTEFSETNTHAMNYKLNNKESKDDTDIIYSTELGLAIEKPPPGVSIDKLWKIIVAQGTN